MNFLTKKRDTIDKGTGKSCEKYKKLYIDETSEGIFEYYLPSTQQRKKSNRTTLFNPSPKKKSWL